MASTLWRSGLSGLALLAFIGPAAAAEPSYPQLTGRVVDDADLLSAADIAELDAGLKALEDKSSDQVVVVTLPSLQGFTIEDFGYQLGRRWGIGTKEKDNGVLLIVAPNERKVRIEVGRGLEPLLTDAMSNVIINGAILPRFRSGDYAGGIKEGVKGIELVLTGDAAELAERVKGRRDADDPKIDWLVVLFWTIIIVWFIWVTWRSTQRQAYGRRGGPVFIPASPVAEGASAVAAPRAAGKRRWNSSAPRNAPRSKRPSPRPSARRAARSSSSPQPRAQAISPMPSCGRRFLRCSCHGR